MKTQEKVVLDIWKSLNSKTREL